MGRTFPFRGADRKVWTTRAYALERTKRASINSAVLPKLTLSSPPIALPARSASCSVAAKSIGEHGDGGGAGEEDPGRRRVDEVAPSKG